MDLDNGPRVYALLDETTDTKLIRRFALARPHNNYSMKDFNWFNTKSNSPWLKLDVDVPDIQMLNEALPWKEKCISRHYLLTDKELEESSGWSCGCIHGHSFSQIQSRGTYDDRIKGLDTGYRWIQDVVDTCPLTFKFFDKFFRPHAHYRRIRWMWLEPGGYIASHQDAEERTLALNVYINSPKGFKFIMNGSEMPTQDGSVFLIDAGVTHETINESNEPRLMIQVHGKSNRDDYCTEQYNETINRSLDKYKGTKYIGPDVKFDYVAKDIIWPKHS